MGVGVGVGGWGLATEGYGRGSFPAAAMSGRTNDPRAARVDESYGPPWIITVADTAVTRNDARPTSERVI